MAVAQVIIALLAVVAVVRMMLARVIRDRLVGGDVLARNALRDVVLAREFRIMRSGLH